MEQVIAFAFKLMIVSSISEKDGSAFIRFENNQGGRLSGNVKNYQYYITLAHRSLERKQPVGVAFQQPDTILEMARADNDLLARTEERPDELRVWLQGHNGQFHLRRDHPRYSQLRDLLQHALIEKSRVWFVTRTMTNLDDVLIHVEPKR